MNKCACHVWGTLALSAGNGIGGEKIYSARTGGYYQIDIFARERIKNLTEAEKIRLTTWLVRQRGPDTAHPRITMTTLTAIKHMPDLLVAERVDGVLRYLASRSDIALGHTERLIQTEVQDYLDMGHERLAWTGSKDIQEFNALAKHCHSRGWVDLGFSEYDGALSQLTLLVGGYERLEKIDGLNEINHASRQAFIAMWFDSTMNGLYNQGICPAISTAGYEPFRIDNKQHNNKICDEVIAEIRRSRFLVADLTYAEKDGVRGNVYYEAGFAKGLGVPVIYTCRECQVKKIHFDIRQYICIPWDNPSDLAKPLAARILAEIGEGPLKETT